MFSLCKDDLVILNIHSLHESWVLHSINVIRMTKNALQYFTVIWNKQVTIDEQASVRIFALSRGFNARVIVSSKIKFILGRLHLWFYWRILSIENGIKPTIISSGPSILQPSDRSNTIQLTWRLYYNKRLFELQFVIRQGINFESMFIKVVVSINKRS